MQKTKNYPTSILLKPSSQASGVIQLPGSKSISNRILLLSALAQDETCIHDLLASDDTLVMLNALQKLGVQWKQVVKEGEPTQTYRVKGSGGQFPVQHADLFMGNAGTAIRPLVAALAILGGDYTLHGVPRMHERPIGDLVDALNDIGAQITYTGEQGFPPLHIQRGHIHQTHWKVNGSVSSQFLTALLMAAPLIAQHQDVTIEVQGDLISKPYIEITLNLMQRFGVHVQQNGWQSFTIPSGQSYQSPQDIYVEGDASSASYFIAAAAITGGTIRIEGIGKNSIQGDIRFADAVKKMGAHITWGENFLQVQGVSEVLQALDMDCNHIPDAAMTLAVMALYANGTTTLRNIASWRVKETDRIHAMANELRKCGAQVEEGADYLRITPPEHIQEASIETYDDHRMAMCFSLASLHGANKTGAAIRILDPQCVAKTYPEYFTDFMRLCS